MFMLKKYQSICKIASAIYLLVWWGIKLAKFHRQIDVALSAMLVLLISVLMATQMHVSSPICVMATLIFLLI